MPIHENSVIPTKLNNFHPKAYSSLTDQENYCYTQSTKGGYTEYAPFFSNLASAIDNWFAADRTDSTRDLIEGAYVYIMFGNNFGTGLSMMNQLNARDLINMDGLLATFSSRPVDYYDDYYDPTLEPTYDPVNSGSQDTTPTAERLEADAPLISKASEVENSRLVSLGESYRRVANRHSFKMLFDPPRSTGNSIGYEEIADIIFIQKEWKVAFQLFNIDLELPGYL